MKPTERSETTMPLVPRMSRNLRPRRSTSATPTMVMVKLTTVRIT
jgi:hypothetical protein